MITKTDFSHTLLDDMVFMDEFYEAAKTYDVPASEDDTEKVDDMEGLFELVDEYTSIYIYGIDDGLYRAGRYAPIMDQQDFRFVLDMGYWVADGEAEDVRVFPLQFQNTTAMVMMYNYQRALFVYPYLAASLCAVILLFFFILLFFVNRKLKSILILKQDVLTMASGDLTHPVTNFGGDEIGILAEELDGLRNSLNETILKEQESRKANQDLITALSHDLRTPLTILTGYLEVLRLKRNPVMQEEYLERAFKKTEDIKELTDRMFEYALVSEENETPDITWISTDFIIQCLQENCDFIKLTGFIPQISIPDITGILKSDKTMLKRIFNNLFSNIIKYGDKKQTVNVSGRLSGRTFIITVSNSVKQGALKEDSSNIGLRNTQRMIQILGGDFEIENKNGLFTVRMNFPLQ